MPPFVMPDQQSPIVLKAMTLRGIGSYLHGSRLVIEPLTVLCGKNGSGKSTWLKALNLLKESLEFGRLPYEFSRPDSAADGIEFTNAFYFFEPPAAHEQFGSVEEAMDFGLPGTIGLELEVLREYALPTVPRHGTFTFDPPECSNEVQEFVWKGCCRKGSHLRLRVAHPGHEVDAVDTPQLVDFIELQFNDESIIRLEGPREPARQDAPGQFGPRRSLPYTLSCSPAFLSRRHRDLSGMVQIGALTDINRRKWTELLTGIDDSYATTLLDHFEARFRQILGLALDGVFHIGAIRRTQDSQSLKPITHVEAERIAKRSVGLDGEYSWLLERAFGGNCMRPVTELGEIQPRDVEEYYGRILDRLNDGTTARAKQIFNAATPSLRERILRLAAGEFGDHTEPTALLAEFFNSLLDSRDLFDRDAWKHHFEEASFYGDGLPPDPEIRYWGEMGPAKLNRKCLRRFNALLVRDFITYGGERDGYDDALAETNDTYKFVSYLSQWLNRLIKGGLETPRELGKSPVAKGEAPAHLWGNVSEAPTGLLLDPQHASSFREDPDDTLARLFHPCFGSKLGGYAQLPRQFPAGFHQIFPILVQLGLMRADELLAIENPEVHLHPGLQLELTEALIKHIPSGRRLIIETHSDLVVRRVLRAIMQEEDGLGQSQVAIYFADLNPEEHGYDNSTLDRLHINDKGQIDNWPNGFMDDDVKESRRLMEAMYGTSEEDDEEPEQ
jgi:hypothetical protein